MNHQIRQNFPIIWNYSIIDPYIIVWEKLIVKNSHVKIVLDTINEKVLKGIFS